MVQEKQIENQKLKQVCREFKRTRPENSNASIDRFEVQNNPRIKKIFSNQGPPNTPKINKGKISTPKSQERKGNGAYIEKRSCAKYGRKHEGKFLAGIGNFYCCGKSVHMKSDFHIL